MVSEADLFRAVSRLEQSKTAGEGGEGGGGGAGWVGGEGIHMVGHL